MNRSEVMEIGKWMMIAGAGLFTAGAGINFVCGRIEKKELKKVHDKEMLELEAVCYKNRREVEDKALAAAAEKDRIYAERLAAMGEEEFAKHHAERVAKANADVVANAERVIKEAESSVLKTRMECNDAMDKLRAECLAKVEEANRRRDEAISKYEAIDTLFTNKKEILKAKEMLEEAARKDARAKEDKEELLKSIKDILE